MPNPTTHPPPHPPHHSTTNFFCLLGSRRISPRPHELLQHHRQHTLLTTPQPPPPHHPPPIRGRQYALPSIGILLRLRRSTTTTLGARPNRPTPHIPTHKRRRTQSSTRSASDPHGPSPIMCHLCCKEEAAPGCFLDTQQPGESRHPDQIVAACHTLLRRVQYPPGNRIATPQTRHSHFPIIRQTPSPPTLHRVLRLPAPLPRANTPDHRPTLPLVHLPRLQ